MDPIRKKLTDAHGDEVMYMHADVLDAELDPAEKIVMMVLRRMAFPTGWVCQHYKDVAKQSRMPLSTVKNKDGVMDRLRNKGWIKGVSRDGECIEVKMSPNWKSKSGEPSEFDDRAAAESVPVSAENPGTESVPAGTEPVPGAVPNRYRTGTEPVPPSDNEKGRKVKTTKMSETPVALTGSGSIRREETGASLNFVEKTACGAGTPAAVPRLSPDLAATLRVEARLWTEQVAATLNRGLVKGRDLSLKRPAGQDPVKVVSMKVTGSKPWSSDLEAVYGFAMSRYPAADPVHAFRAVIRACACYKKFAQAILGHAYRMQAAKGYDRPQIKLCSLLRLDNTGKNVPERVLEMEGEACGEVDGEDMGRGNLLERAQNLVYMEPAQVCVHAPVPVIVAELRNLLDYGGRYSDACWDRCWNEASARCAASTVPVVSYARHVAAIKHNEYGGENQPLPWIADSLNPEWLFISHAEARDCDVGLCGNWGGPGEGTVSAPGSDEVAASGDGGDPGDKPSGSPPVSGSAGSAI